MLLLFSLCIKSLEVKLHFMVDYRISYGRSHSLTNPSTGSVVAAKNLPDQEAVESFVNRINPPIDTGEFVRPYYSPSQ